MYKPSTPFNVGMILLVPTYTKSKGVEKKIYPTNGIPFYGSFKTYGGTENEINGVLSIENTGVIDTWYRPEFAANCRVYIPQNGATYEIIGTPENIEMRNQFLKFKVSEVKGGA